jgi:hypothetical protein
MDPDGDRLTKLAEQAILLAAGVAELALDNAVSAVKGSFRVMRRRDLRELVTESHQDLVARGELALNRHVQTPVPHMELLARYAVAQHRGGDA